MATLEERRREILDKRDIDLKKVGMIQAPIDTRGASENDRIKEGRPVRSFTDDPALVGTQNLKIGPKYGGGPSVWEVPPEDPRASRKQAATAKKQSKIPPRPPGNAMYPPGESDFKNREKYSSFVIGKMGFDPDALDPYEEVERAQELELPTVFEKAFNGKILYRDKDNLTKEEKDHWTAVHKAFNVHVKNRAVDKATRGKDEYKTRMKIFDDRLTEKKAIPALMQTSLESIFISLDEDGKKIGKVPAGELSSAIRIAEQMVNEGATGYEAIDKATKAIIKNRLTRQSMVDALNEIPKFKTGFFAKNAIEPVKAIVDGAIQQGASRDDVSKKLKEQGWSGKDIAKLLPKDTAAEPTGVDTENKAVIAQGAAMGINWNKVAQDNPQIQSMSPAAVNVFLKEYTRKHGSGASQPTKKKAVTEKPKKKSEDKMPKPDFAPMKIGGGTTKEQRQVANKNMNDFLDRHLGLGTKSWKGAYGNAKKAGGWVFENYMKLARIIDAGWAKTVESQKESIKSLGK